MFNGLWIFIAVSIFMVLCSTQDGEVNSISSCTYRTTCSDCIKGGQDCAWCKSHNATMASRERCDVLENLRKRCSEVDIVNPLGKTNLTRDVPLSSKGASVKNIVQLMPQEIRLVVRPSSPRRVTVKFRQAEDYPVDLYFLMDLSNSMKDDKVKLASLGKLLNTEMGKITRNFQLGFGSFVDKRLMPYVSTVPEKLINPCEGCAAPYGFKNHMRLSDDADSFVQRVTDADTSGNLDDTEGTFDAMLQAMVCTEAIGWRDRARRILLVATDAGFHMAGDGKLGGVVVPNDGKCHIDSDGTYSMSTLQDYPSISQISSKATRNKINVLFAATDSQFRVYEELSTKIDGSHAGQLTKNSDNIVELIQQQYEKISDKVELKDNASKYLKVSYFSNCLSGKTGDPEQSNVCGGLKVGTTVSFIVEVELIWCPRNPDEWHQTFQISPVGLNETLVVSVDMICECDCEKQGTEVKDSNLCDGVGTFECGVCNCPKDRIGQHCECDSSKAEFDTDDSKCKKDNSSVICSGRGVCTCGECACYPQTSESRRVYGDFCECDNFNCRIAPNELMCSGHGKCDCRNCICDVGWMGDDCYCSSSKASCMALNGEICSGHGECDCGGCHCERFFAGAFCENDETPGARCLDLKLCVQCAIAAKENYTIFCNNECDYSVTFVDEAKVERENEYRCQIKDENECQSYFVYAQTKDKSDPRIRAEVKKECPVPLNVPLVSLGVIGSVVVAGVCLLLAWKLLTEVHDRREYAKFERDRALAKWEKADNPIYIQAVTTFSNPMYGDSDDDK